MVVILKTIFMRDLRGNWVFPRLAFAATSEALNRNIGRLNRFLFRRPANRIREFSATVNDHQNTAEILLAAFAIFTALIRSLPLLLVAIGLLYLIVTKF